MLSPVPFVEAIRGVGASGVVVTVPVRASASREAEDHEEEQREKQEPEREEPETRPNGPHDLGRIVSLIEAVVVTGVVGGDPDRDRCDRRDDRS